MDIGPIRVPRQHLQPELQMPFPDHQHLTEQFGGLVGFLGQPVPGRFIMLIQLVIDGQLQLIRYRLASVISCI